MKIALLLFLLTLSFSINAVKIFRYHYCGKTIIYEGTTLAKKYLLIYRYGKKNEIDGFPTVFEAMNFFYKHKELCKTRQKNCFNINIGPPEGCKKIKKGKINLIRYN